MTAVPPALAAVAGRIAQIQAQLGVTTRPAADPSTTGAASFAQALDAATPAASPRSAATPAPSAAPATPVPAMTGPGADVATAAADVSPLARGALAHLGVDYRWGGTDPATGLDCSGLVQTVGRTLGLELPRTTYDQVNAGTAVSSLAEARPGDLVFFRTPPDHVGVYLGEGWMVDAPHTGAQVRVEKVWATPSSIRRVEPAVTAPAGDVFAGAGARWGIDPALLRAVATVESGGRPDAVSPAGAQGLMQLMPTTAAGLGVDPMDPAQAVDGAARLLAGYLRREPSVEVALADYNAGPGAVARAGHTVPAIGETQDYVRKVLAVLRGGAA